MPLQNSFQRNPRRKQAADALLSNVSVAGIPPSRELGFVMLQAEQCAPQPKTICWRSQHGSYELQVICKGGTPSWKLFQIDEDPPVLKWSVVSEDPEQIYRLILKRTNPDSSIVSKDAGAQTRTEFIARGSLFLNRYEIGERIAHGGMGQIFRAKDLTMNRDVALKVLHFHLSDDDAAKRRFEREMQACLNLKHPSIVSVYDYGYTDELTPYMVMEFLNGCTLEHYLLEKGPLALHQFAQVFTQISGAVKQAHEKQIIHRDLKPSNIMIIEQSDGGLLAKVVDFGIAKTVGNNSGVTKTGEIVGTLYYMSPEQCQDEPIDLRSDVYALGCVMYEALCGVRPFEGETPLQTMMQHLHQEPMSLNVRCSTIPMVLEKIVFKALEKCPADRYQTLSELSNAIMRFQSEQAELKADAQGEWNSPLPLTGAFATYTLDEGSEDSMLSEMCDAPLPGALELLVAAGFIESDDASAVVIFKQMHGGSEGRYLNELGCIDQTTYSLAVECETFKERYGLTVEHTASVLRYCHTKGIGFEEALTQLG